MYDLSHNGLSGTLDPVFKGLRTLNLQYNNLTGIIPSNFFDDQSVMRQLNIGSNRMNGTIPADIGFASQMTGLFVFENAFTGSIPNLGNMPLQVFQGQNNKFTGMLPFDLFYGTWAETIREWWAFDNQLSGPLSENLGLFPRLQDFRVGNNTLEGTIPVSTYDARRLFRLQVNDNLLTGPISPGIDGLSSLETFDVSGNQLTGTIPTEIGSLSSLQVVRTQFNLFTGVIPGDLCFLGSMEVLEADCLPETSPPTECFCCTSCCDRDRDVCVRF
jgi:Leucine-rich repeat (LRR) protein